MGTISHSASFPSVKPGLYEVNWHAEIAHCKHGRNGVLTSLVRITSSEGRAIDVQR